MASSWIFLVSRPVVAKVDYLDPVGLKKPSHDVDRDVVAVKEARGGNKSEFFHPAYYIQLFAVPRGYLARS